MRRLIFLAAAAGVVSLIAAGDTAIAAGPAVAASLPQLTIAMNRSSINVGGALQSGAVDVHMTTTNEKSGSPALVRLNPGVTPDQALALLHSRAGKDPNNVRRVGSIVFAAEAPKGTSDVQTTLQPGQYFAADTAGTNPATFPHTSFTIGQAAQPAALPAPKATVRAIDFAFRGPTRLRDGELVRFENDGFVAHMIVAVGAKDMATARRVVSLLRAGKEKQVQRLASGFESFEDPVSPGGLQQEVIKAKPGVWVLACFMDTQDHREHTELGMERIIHVAR